MSDRRIRYSLDDEKRFVVEDYNWAIPFSNFLPGIAGLWGVPLWVYYVNRGQAVCSVGVRDKDHQLLEFLSFNRVCQVVPDEGSSLKKRSDCPITTPSGGALTSMYRPTRSRSSCWGGRWSSTEMRPARTRGEPKVPAPCATHSLSETERSVSSTGWGWIRSWP